MPSQAPWSPTAHAFAQHQFNHVTSFWKQGRPARFQLEALPGGHAKLNLTFELPPASDVVPPPFHALPVPDRQHRHPIPPLFPTGCFPQGFGADKSCDSKKKVSSRRRKSYRRSVLHRAALAAPSLPPPMNGSLRQAALASVQRQQADAALPMSTQSAKKRPLPDSPSATFPSNLPPLTQRIRKDIQVGEGENESPEKEVLRSSPFLENSPSPLSPCVKGIPSPAPLVFTPVLPDSWPEKQSCRNCNAMTTKVRNCQFSTLLRPNMRQSCPPSCLLFLDLC